MPNCCCRSNDDSQYVKAERHDPGRSCTDVYCLIIFILFIAGMVTCAVFSAQIGDPNRLLYGVDSWGNACNQRANQNIEKVVLSGRDTSGLENLFYFNPLDSIPKIKRTSPVVCVSKCPNATIANVSDIVSLYEVGIKICRYDVVKADFFAKNPIEKAEKTSKLMKLCPKDVTPHISVLNRCVPLKILKFGKSIQSSVSNVLDATFELLEFSSCDPKSSWIRKVANDYKATYREMILLGFIAIVMSFCMILLMKLFACVLIWAMYILAGTLSTGACAYCWYRYKDIKNSIAAIPERDRVDEDLQLEKNWMIYSIIVTCFTIILLFILLVIRSRLALVIQLFEESSKAIGKMPFILIVPFITLFVLVGSMVGVAFGALFVFTAAYPLVDPETEFVTYEIDNIIFYARWYYLFGLLWVIQFILACQQMLIAGAIAGWYFTRNKRSLGMCNQHFINQSLKNLVVYHLGTVAVGSFIIALVQLFRIVLMYIQEKLQGKKNMFVEYLLKVLQCCFWCLEKVLKYINRNAYIMTAVFGYNFCRAGHRAFTLLVGNILRVGAINTVGSFTLFLGNCTVTAAVVLIGMIIIKANHTICHFFIPLTTMGLFTFIVAYTFLGVFGMAVDTIFLSFCEDTEKNDGLTKPYFMSKGLMTFVDKVNEQQLAPNDLSVFPEVQ